MKTGEKIYATFLFSDKLPTGGITRALSEMLFLEKSLKVILSQRISRFFLKIKWEFSGKIFLKIRDTIVMVGAGKTAPIFFILFYIVSVEKSLSFQQKCDRI